MDFYQNLPDHSQISLLTLECKRIKFLATISPLKMLRNAFYFTLKALFAPKTFKFLS